MASLDLSAYTQPFSISTPLERENIGDAFAVVACDTCSIIFRLDVDVTGESGKLEGVGDGNGIAVAPGCPVDIKSPIIVSAVNGGDCYITIRLEMLCGAAEKSTDKHMIGIATVNRRPASDVGKLKYNQLELLPPKVSG